MEPSTLRRYDNIIMRLEKHLNIPGRLSVGRHSPGQKFWAKVDSKQVEKAVKQLWSDASPATWNVALAAIRYQEAQLLAAGSRSTPLVPTTLDYRKVPERLPNPISEDEVKKLATTKMSAQDQALVEILLGSGLRAGEAARICLGDIEPPGILRVIGKGNKERKTFITSAGMEAIQNLTLSNYQGADNFTPVERTAEFWNLVQQYPSVGLFTAFTKPVRDLKDPTRWVERQVNKHIGANPHRFRHFWVTDLLNNEADLMAVMNAAGHESIKTTRGYKKVLQRELISLRSKHSREQGRL